MRRVQIMESGGSGAYSNSNCNEFIADDLLASPTTTKAQDTDIKNSMHCIALVVQISHQETVKLYQNVLMPTSSRPPR